MRYFKYTVQTTTEAEDIITGALYDLGIEGALVEDNVPLTEEEKAGMFVDILPDQKEDDGSAFISFFLEEDAPRDEILSKVKEELAAIGTWMDAGPLTVTVSETKDDDYLNNWKQYFHQFYVDDILITPSWEEVKDSSEASMIIHIDPGTAFGTGMHETTQLCIRGLRKYLKAGDSFLDVGSGSGILAIMAYKFGAGFALGTDLDICAVDAVKENMEANDLSDRDYRLLIGNIIDDPSVQDTVGYGKYDVIAANILAEVLIELAPEVHRHIKPGGVFITSGILIEKEEVVKQAFTDAGFTILEVNEQGEWAGIIARWDR